jgi:hypothetical protein
MSNACETARSRGNARNSELIVSVFSSNSGAVSRHRELKLWNQATCRIYVNRQGFALNLSMQTSSRNQYRRIRVRAL